MKNTRLSYTTEKALSIAIVGNPVNTLGRDVFLCKFIDILSPFSNRILIISGDFRCKKKLPQNVKTIFINGDEKKESLIIRTFKFLLREVHYSFVLIKNVKMFDLVIVFGAERFLPTLTSKILRKKVLLHVGGRFSLHARAIYKNSLWGIGHSLIPAIGLIEEQIALSLCDGIIVESPFAVRNLKLQKYAFKVFTQGATYVDTETFYPQNTENITRRKYIGFVGRLSKEKGIIEFLESIPLILQRVPDLEFMVVGDGPLRNEVKDFLIRNKLTSKVHYIGYVENDKLVEIFNTLKLLVLPSYSEGVPNVLLEAMSCGVPVLATPVGGIPSIITDKRNGFLLRNNTKEEIAKTIEAIVLHYNYLLPEMSKECRKVVLEYFSLEAARKRYREILENFFYSMPENIE
jgi:glycosyltransferase involved in cell wall biosynthesis